MEYKDRLKAARKHANLTQGELAAKVGITQTSISDLERGKSVSSSFNASIARTCGVNALWLENGTGEMVSGGGNGIGEQPGSYGAMNSGAADKVLAMLSKHKGLSASARDQIAQAVQQTVAEAVQTSNVITADFSRRALVGDEIRIAHYDVQGAMGHGKLVHDYPEMFRDVTVSQQYLRELGITYKDPSHLKLISGDGQSMAPKIQHMDPLLSDVSVREFVGDGIYAFIWQGLFYIKSLQVEDAEHFLMVSADAVLYPPKRIRIEDTYIQARVLLVWNAQKL
jgi:phage repressor protein C with HTH and peptisase S24 domain